jgi:hypothetical protein
MLNRYIFIVAALAISGCGDPTRVRSVPKAIWNALDTSGRNIDVDNAELLATYGYKSESDVGEHEMNSPEILLGDNHVTRIQGDPNLIPHPNCKAPKNPRLLIDYTHANNFDVGGFTTSLKQRGWSVTTLHSAPLTLKKLASYHVLMIPPLFGDSFRPFTPEEVEAVKHFVMNGGGIWALHEYVRNPAGINSLAAAFGVLFRQNIVFSDKNKSHTFWPYLTDFLPNTPLTYKVKSAAYYAGSTLIAANDSLSIVAYAYAGFGNKRGRAPVMAAGHFGRGRAFFSGDSTPLHPSDYSSDLSVDDRRFLHNIANWLACAD